jgi:DNA-directed RNA polymerase specialized sigma24 family protein
MSTPSSAFTVVQTARDLIADGFGTTDDEFWARLMPVVRSYAHRVASGMGQLALADDLATEVAFLLWHKVDWSHEPRQIAAWLHVRTRGMVLTWHTSRQRDERRTREWATQHFPLLHADTPPENLLHDIEVHTVETVRAIMRARFPFHGAVMDAVLAGESWDRAWHEWGTLCGANSVSTLQRHVRRYLEAVYREVQQSNSTLA